MYMCTVYGYVHFSASTYVGQKRATYPIELGFQAAVSHLMWVLENKLRFSAPAVHIITHESLQPLQSYLPTRLLRVALRAWLKPLCSLSLLEPHDLDSSQILCLVRVQQGRLPSSVFRLECWLKELPR